MSADAAQLSLSAVGPAELDAIEEAAAAITAAEIAAFFTEEWGNCHTSAANLHHEASCCLLGLHFDKALDLPGSNGHPRVASARRHTTGRMVKGARQVAARLEALENSTPVHRIRRMPMRHQLNMLSGRKVDPVKPPTPRGRNPKLLERVADLLGFDEFFWREPQDPWADLAEI